MLVKMQGHTARSLSAILGDSLGDACLLQAVTVAQEPPQMRLVGVRRRLLAYAQFWQRMVDQGIAMTIFLVLFVLSFLPILQMQTQILFNRAFATILERKIHKQELLDDLYTPGLFHKVEADPEGPLARPAKQLRKGLRRTSLCRGRKAVTGESSAPKGTKTIAKSMEANSERSPYLKNDATVTGMDSAVQSALPTEHRESHRSAALANEQPSRKTVAL